MKAIAFDAEYRNVLTRPTVLGCMLSVEAKRRMSRGGRPVDLARVAHAAWDDAWYCIDAPECIPAGATEAVEINDGDDSYRFAAQLSIDRGRRWA